MYELRADDQIHRSATSAETRRAAGGFGRARRLLADSGVGRTDARAARGGECALCRRDRRLRNRQRLLDRVRLRWPHPARRAARASEDHRSLWAISAPLAGLPPIYAGGPQGLVGAIADKDFATNRTIYIAYTAPDPNAPTPAPRLAGVLTVARARLSSDSTKLEDVKVLLSAEGIGGKMIQARDGTLLISSSIPAGVGILSADWPQPQQLDSLMGKVLRINTDGTVPKDNPFVGRPNARGEIFALGIRDDQGLAFHPRTGRLWASEHGPRGGDEVNVIEKGKNYGFPVIGYGHDYNGASINKDRTSQAGMEQPAYFWTPDIAPGGISFYSGKLFPAWNGNLFVAALAGKHLARLVLQGDRVIGEERLLAELDTRIRDVKEGPDGALYVLTDRDGGKLLKLVPPKESSSRGSR